MRRVLALASGAALGVGAYYAVQALKHRYAAASLGPALVAARAEAGGFVTALREGMAEREEQLRLALGLDMPPPGTRLDPQATRDLLADPAAWGAR